MNISSIPTAVHRATTPRHGGLVAAVAAALLLTACPTAQRDNVTPGIPTGGTGDFPCPVDQSWLHGPGGTSPTPPSEIPGGGTDFCQFYQFSWQWFLYLMHPSDTHEGLRNFQVAKDYPTLLATGDSCTTKDSKQRFFVRVVKDKRHDGKFTLPERIDQAGKEAVVIYDQPPAGEDKGNVVFYSVQFGRELCSVPNPVPSTGDLPVGTLELKLAWRVITDAEKADYLWIDADVIPETGDGIPETLGLIGFHLAKGTQEHPELVWASFEHKSNAPNCVAPAPAPSSGWSFMSATCQSCLVSPTNECLDACQLNKPVNSGAAALTGPPTEICRVFPEGTAPGDNKGVENVTVVRELNNELVGPQGLLTKLPASDHMAILKNYFNIGAIWVSDIQQPSSTTSNQRGSLQLANPIMETVFQGALNVEVFGSETRIVPSTSGVLNCFGCHNYVPGNTLSSGLSHIVDDIHTGAPGQ